MPAAPLPSGDALTCNASGDVAFLAGNDDGTEQILRTTLAGGTPVTIAATAGSSIFSNLDLGSISINDAGTVAFVAQLKAGGYGVFTSTGVGEPTTIVDTKTDPQFSSFRSASLNNKGASPPSATSRRAARTSSSSTPAAEKCRSL